MRSFAVILAASFILSPAAIGQENDPEWRTQIEAGNSEMAVDEFQNAEVHFQLATELAQAFDDNDPRKAYTSMRLADVSVMLNKTKEARQRYEKALEVFREKEDDSLEQLAHCYISLGDLDFIEGKTEAAKDRYERALRVHEVLKEKPLGLIASLYGIARCHRVRKDIDKAEAHLGRALKIVDEGRANPVNLGALLSEMALIKMLQGQFSTAESLVSAAIQKSTETRGARHLEVADALETKAELMRLTNRGALAKQLREQAAKIRART